ncbi:hypothetical protein BY996DRAFT_8390919 [Phakopsora pachyrhizi]|nr:hypothetical protein BY996DRAFT_8390919 [Phakopsora pachyrhizi]
MKMTSWAKSQDRRVVRVKMRGLQELLCNNDFSAWILCKTASRVQTTGGGARGDDVVCEIRLIDFWPTLGAGGVVVEMDQGEEREWEWIFLRKEIGRQRKEKSESLTETKAKERGFVDTVLQKFDKSFEENREIWMGSGRRMEKWMEAGSTVKSERCLFIKNEEEDEEGQKDKS